MGGSLANIGGLFEAAGTGTSVAGGAMGFWPSLALGLTLSGVGQLMSMAGQEEPKTSPRQHKELYNRQTAASNMLSGGGPRPMGGVPISRGGTMRDPWMQGSSLPG